MKTRRERITEIIEEIVKYEKSLDCILFDKDKQYMKNYKQFLVEGKIQEAVKKLLEEKEICSLVAESANTSVFNNQYLLEWEQYKNIPKTNLTYRFDKGKGTPGNQDHVHVFLGNTKSQVYAINIDGTPHDGSAARLGKKEINFLKGLGFTPPKDGLLEWIKLDQSKNYIGYKAQLLFS